MIKEDSNKDDNFVLIVNSLGWITGLEREEEVD